MLKAISPLVAVILLVALAVAVAGIMGTWLLTFGRTQTEIVGKEAGRHVLCSLGRLTLKDVGYCSANDRLTGRIFNEGSIALGELRLEVHYTNITFREVPLCKIDTSIVECTQANASLEQGRGIYFNVSAGGSNIQLVRVLSNCTEVRHEVQSGDIASTC
ncbi:TPA: hypothetical protein EYP27_05310 [Candidatus Bathyarchaeota archaeon]|nr:hypothetical protein [Candidatus Bathyarchaeota archaeon]